MHRHLDKALQIERSTTCKMEMCSCLETVSYMHKLKYSRKNECKWHDYEGLSFQAALLDLPPPNLVQPPQRQRMHLDITSDHCQMQKYNFMVNLKGGIKEMVNIQQ